MDVLKHAAGRSAHVLVLAAVAFVAAGGCRASSGPVDSAPASAISSHVEGRATPRPEEPAPPSGPPAGPFKAISLGAQAACAIRTDGTLACWDRAYQVIAAPMGSFKQVSVGPDHSCGLDDLDRVVCWSSAAHAVVPAKGIPAGRFHSVCAGEGYSCAARAKGGDVECWGDHEGMPLPREITSVVCARPYAACGLRADGKLLCWSPRLVREQGLRPVVENANNLRTPLRSISNGLCGLSTDGQVVCARDGDPDNHVTFSPSGKFVDLSADWDHACAVGENGRATCWGSNDVCQSAPPNKEMIAVGAAGQWSCGILTNGSLTCWGRQGPGQECRGASRSLAPIDVDLRVACSDAPRTAAVSLALSEPVRSLQSTPPPCGAGNPLFQLGPERLKVITPNIELASRGGAWELRAIEGKAFNGVGLEITSATCTADRCSFFLPFTIGRAAKGDDETETVQHRAANVSLEGSKKPGVSTVPCFEPVPPDPVAHHAIIIECPVDVSPPAATLPH